MSSSEYEREMRRLTPALRQQVETARENLLGRLDATAIEAALRAWLDPFDVSCEFKREYVDSQLFGARDQFLAREGWSWKARTHKNLSQRVMPGDRIACGSRHELFVLNVEFRASAAAPIVWTISGTVAAHR